MPSQLEEKHRGRGRPSIFFRSWRMKVCRKQWLTEPKMLDVIQAGIPPEFWQLLYEKEVTGNCEAIKNGIVGNWVMAWLQIMEHLLGVSTIITDTFLPQLYSTTATFKFCSQCFHYATKEFCALGVGRTWNWLKLLGFLSFQGPWLCLHFCTFCFSDTVCQHLWEKFLEGTERWLFWRIVDSYDPSLAICIMWVWWIFMKTVNVPVTVRISFQDNFITHFL